MPGTGTGAFWVDASKRLPNCFNALTGLSCYSLIIQYCFGRMCFNALTGLSCYGCRCTVRHRRKCFNALTGLSCYLKVVSYFFHENVSMPSRAWVVTARMSNILNFSWYFLCIPAIYRCILAYLPIFLTNYLSFWGANPLVLFWELAFRTTLLSFYC